jgi:signal transduction histidine kinase
VILHQIDDVLELIVSDEGAGFDPISLPQVGESGAGYGLFSIRERLYLLGGRLEIQSAPGQGSRFIVTMPIEHAAYKESSPKPIIGKAQITS